MAVSYSGFLRAVDSEQLIMHVTTLCYAHYSTSLDMQNMSTQLNTPLLSLPKVN